MPEVAHPSGETGRRPEIGRTTLVSPLAARGFPDFPAYPGRLNQRAYWECGRKSRDVSSSSRPICDANQHAGRVRIVDWPTIVISVKRLPKLPPDWSAPLGVDTDQAADLSVCRMLLIFELLRAEISQRRMEPASVVDFVDEAGKVLGDVVESFDRQRIDRLEASASS